MFSIPKSMRNRIDKILVGLVNSIMGIQMMGSLAIFVKSVYLIIREKLKKRNLVKPVDLTEFTGGKLVKD